MILWRERITGWMIVAGLPLALGLLCVMVSCSTLTTSTATTFERALARQIGFWSVVAIPEAKTPLNTVCTVAGSSDRDLMVKGLQQLWTSASDAQAKAVVDDLNLLVGETKIMDAPVTSENLGKWRTILGDVCSGSAVK